jgi:hypothetical protein
MGSKKKSKKSSITEEEKKLIFKLKLELNSMDVPRSEWASAIQQEITQYRQLKNMQQKAIDKQNPGKIRKAFNLFSEKAQLLFSKILGKTLLRGQADGFGSEEGLEQMMQDAFESGTGGMMDPFGMMEDQNAIPKGAGTFLIPEQQKKSQVVSFDDDDDDN